MLQLHHGLITIILLFLCTQIYASDDLENELYLERRVRAHMALHDFASAVDEAYFALNRHPQSAALHEVNVRALAMVGEEKRMLRAWEVYYQLFPEKAFHRELIEDMAWGVLKKASHSSSLVMRQMSLLAALFSQQAQGVEILHRAMRDPNYAIRAHAVKLSSHFCDHKLKEEIKRLFVHEKAWVVRQNVLEAIGRMKIVELRPALEALLASEESLSGEKVLAITALLELLDDINRQELEHLSKSSHSGLRQLACRAIAYYQSMRDIDLLILLSKDANGDVRLESIQALGQLRSIDRSHEMVTIARKGILDANYEVSTSAAWLLTLYEPVEGQRAFARLLQDERGMARWLAAAALGASGPYGSTLAEEQFRNHPDPYVKLNLALGLIGLRQSVTEAGEHIKAMLAAQNDKWRWAKSGLFRTIVNKPSAEYDPLITPEIEDQLLRLELLNLIAVLKVGGAQQAIRDYLAERSWEISATAAILLLTEGDESAIELVKQLLQDPQLCVRLQAALIISLWSREESALKVLEEGYLVSDAEFKARILEGIGRIGSMHSIPFLLNVLKEPSQTLRLIAAMAIIQCLNH